VTALRRSPATAQAEAVGAVLFRAHEAARHLENLLELEAVDPRIAELMQATKRVRKSIAALLVDVAIAACPDLSEGGQPAD
jgi:hypothetical protein